MNKLVLNKVGKHESRYTMKGCIEYLKSEYGDRLVGMDSIMDIQLSDYFKGDSLDAIRGEGFDISINNKARIFKNSTGMVLSFMLTIYFTGKSPDVFDAFKASKLLKDTGSKASDSTCTDVNMILSARSCNVYCRLDMEKFYREYGGTGRSTFKGYIINLFMYLGLGLPDKEKFLSDMLIMLGSDNKTKKHITNNPMKIVVV